MHTSEWPEWFSSRKKSAEVQFKSAQLPSNEDESWRYSQIHKINPHSFQNQIPSQFEYQIPDEVLSLASGFDSVIFFYNGTFLKSASRVKLDAGLKIFPFSSAQKQYDEEALKVSFQRSPNNNLKDLSLDQLASFVDGLFVRINKNCKQNKVLLVYVYGNVLNSQTQSPFRLSTRTHIEIEEGASLEFSILEIAANQIPFMLQHSFSLSIASQAQCDLSIAQWLGSDSISFLDGHTNISNNATLRMGTMSVAGNLTRSDHKILLNEPGANVTYKSLSLGLETGYVDLNSSIEHVQGQTESEQISRSLLNGTSRGVFSGYLKIHKNAQKSNARQKSENVLLSAHAESDTKPQLEVDADDVKAAHGATVGQLNEQEKFYLMSRGISEQKAFHLMTSGFASSTFEHLRSSVAKGLMQRIYNEVQMGNSPENRHE